MERRGNAWKGEERKYMERLGKVIHCKERSRSKYGRTRKRNASYGKPRQYMSRKGMTWKVKEGKGNAGQGKEIQGKEW